MEQGQKMTDEGTRIHDALKQYTNFLSEYAVCLLASGVHTTRIVRNTTRIAASFDTKVEMTVLHKTLTLTLSSHDGQHVYSKVTTISPRPISFRLNTELSKLSWEAYDEHLPIEEIWRRYKAILAEHKINDWVVLVLVGFANAAFCGLFEGDMWACGMVAIATWIGYALKIFMTRKHLNGFGIWFACAFLSSMVASLCGYWHLGHTPDIAIATSALYLVPGVPLINSVIDIVEGHVLAGFARLVDAVLLIGSLAIGLLATTLIIG